MKRITLQFSMAGELLCLTLTMTRKENRLSITGKETTYLDEPCILLPIGENAYDVWIEREESFEQCSLIIHPERITAYTDYLIFNYVYERGLVITQRT